MNRLASASSPYLRQHASNPVDWYPWGDEALALAKREDRPILLSVGYSACHWCHVMAHESFEDPQVAAAMNAHFVNIKVDREERPDLDQLYQGVVQLQGRGGGWPLTVFLTPTLRPFFGGTYFPPGPRHGLPGFRALIEGLGKAWHERRDEVLEQARAFEEGLTELSTLGLGRASGRWTAEDLQAAAQAMVARVDPRFGGFGEGGPRFPNPMNVAFLLRAWKRTADRAFLEPALHTLERMALGGLFDQLGGGFHRYSVDERWLVPHFEKMLYDTAQLLALYSEAQLIAPRPLWQDTVAQSVAWVARELTADDGAFFASQDADSEGAEGRFFAWTPAQLRAVLTPEDAAWAEEIFGVTSSGTFEHGTSVLALEHEPADRPRFQRVRAQLFEARRQRIAPGLDDKVLAGWNGLMIHGLATAARAFRRPDWAAMATRAADAVVGSLVDARGHVARTRTGSPGMLEDAGALAAGQLALFQCTFEPRHLSTAVRIVDAAVTRFWDLQQRAWRAAPRETTDLIVPTWSLHDNALPSGASTMTEAQVVLAALTGEPRHLEHATTWLERMHDEVLENPLAFGRLLHAADRLVDGAAEVTLVGPMEPLRAWLDAQFLPTVALLVKREPAAPETEALLAARTQPGAYLCRHFACQRPVQTVEALRAVLEAQRR